MTKAPDTPGIFNIYFLSTATVVIRTLVNVTFTRTLAIFLFLNFKAFVAELHALRLSGHRFAPAYAFSTIISVKLDT
jgi:hypothetical protein